MSEIRFAPITDGVWRAVVQPESVNVTLITGDDGCVLVDAGASPASGRQIRAAITDVTDAPLRAVVITHEHWDHWFGAAAFTDVEIIGHKGLTEAGDRLSDADLSRLGVAREDIMAPTRAISLAAAVNLGSRQVEVANIGQAHTLTDVIVTVSDSGVLCTGDLVEESAPPQPDNGRIRDWPGVLDVMSSLIATDTVVVPGHGDVVDKPFVFQQRNDLLAITDEITRLVQGGTPLAQAVAAGDWPYPDEAVAPFVERGYAELADEGLVANRQVPLLG